MDGDEKGKTSPANFRKENIRRAQVKVGLRLERRYTWDSCFNQQGDYV
jgi:hypothetical protein